MEKMKEMFMANIRQYAMMVALIFIVILFQYLTGGVLLRPLNITNIIQQNSYILILAIGMLLCILTGNIDLSVGSIVSLVGIVAATMMVAGGVPPILALVTGIVVGLACGAVNGILITRLNGMESAFTGQYDTLIIPHKDTHGVIATVTQALALYGVNIGNFKLTRPVKGSVAIMTIEVDGGITRELVALLRSQPNVADVVHLHAIEGEAQKND